MVYKLLMNPLRNIAFLMFTFCVSICTSCNSNNADACIRDSTTYHQLRLAYLEKITRDISLCSTVDAAAVGFGGVQSEQYERFLLLRKIANDEELIQLTKSANGNVKAYAFLALAERNYPNCNELLQQHIKDTTSFQYRSGCIGGTRFINVFYLNSLQNKLTSSEVACYKTQISKCFNARTWHQVEQPGVIF